MRKVLIIAYHFAPYGGGGVIRIHNFAKYLPLAGYLPIVLTVKDEYYENTYRTAELVDELKGEISLIRTGCLEPAHWGLKDKVYGVTEKRGIDRVTLPAAKFLIKPWLIPDRNITWLPFALHRALKIITSEKIKLIFSTSPPFTSNLIAYLLHRMTRIPYILDYRDDWVGNPLYSSRCPLKRMLEKSMEKMMLRSSSRVICASEDSIRLFKSKYRDIEEDKYILIRNGFDPEYFDAGHRHETVPTDKLRLVYTGSLTPNRTPWFFLQALEQFVALRPEMADRIEVRFIGLVPERIRKCIEESGVRDMVRCQGNLSPREVARILCSEADVCLVFQRKNEGGETAIPGKVYEYLAAGKPVFCMAEGGATVRFLEQTGGAQFAGYEDVEAIKNILADFIAGRKKAALTPGLSEAEIQKFSRKEQTVALGRLFDSITQ